MDYVFYVLDSKHYLHRANEEENKARVKSLKKEDDSMPSYSYIVTAVSSYTIHITRSGCMMFQQVNSG